MGVEVESKAAVRPRLVYLVIAALSVLLILPGALTFPRLYDSFWIDWVWANQFTEALRQGVVYPRWLPSSHGGLGSPVFYYYPPVSFYLSGLFGLAGLTTYASIIATFGLGFLLSGISMYEWLKGWTRFPLAGALFYMAAPYHVMDFYIRGAMAEFVAISFIPLVALGIRRAAEGRGPTLAALAYAALISTHLPLALLTSIFFIAPYALFLARDVRRTLLSIALPVTLGVGLAAIYLIPALALEPFRDAEKLWQDPSLQPANWSLLNWDVPGPARGMRILIAVVIGGFTLTMLSIALRGKSIWALYSGICCIVAAGLVPGLWHLPLLSAVQFPFRLLPLAEFGIATAFALLPRASPLFLFPSLALSAFFLIFSPPNDEYGSIEQLEMHHPDVPENLPPGAREYSWPSNWALQVAASHPAPVLRGGVTIEATFFFPAWRIFCLEEEIKPFPDPATQLLSYRGSSCTKRLSWTGPEKIGAAVSALTLLLLLTLGISQRRNRRARAS